MTDRARQTPSLSLQIDHRYDSDDLTDVESRVATGAWSGATRTYTSPDWLRDRAHDLLRWCENPLCECILEAGANDGYGWLCLRFYVVPGGAACHVRMATRDTGERDEDVWRLSLEIPTEPQMIAQFARQIILMVDGSIGEARLNGIELLYAHPDRPLPPGLADEVRAHRHPNELVWQWSQDSESEAVTVTMIEELIVREHKDIVKKMEGRCAGGGRSLRFAKSAGGWQLTGESSWIS